jgi:hypothetical protein
VACPSSDAGGTVPILGVRERVRRWRLSPTKRKWRLGVAGLTLLLNFYPFIAMSSELLIEITKNGWRCFAKCQGELKTGSHARKGKPVSAGFRWQHGTNWSTSRRAQVVCSRAEEWSEAV